MSKDKTDIYGAFAIWAWGKNIPSEVCELQRFMRKSPLGKYIRNLELKLGRRSHPMTEKNRQKVI